MREFKLDSASEGLKHAKHSVTPIASITLLEDDIPIETKNYGIININSYVITANSILIEDTTNELKRRGDFNINYLLPFYFL